MKSIHGKVALQYNDFALNTFEPIFSHQYRSWHIELIWASSSPSKTRSINVFASLNALKHNKLLKKPQPNDPKAASIVMAQCLLILGSLTMRSWCSVLQTSPVSSIEPRDKPRCYVTACLTWVSGLCSPLLYSIGEFQCLAKISLFPFVLYLKSLLYTIAYRTRILFRRSYSVPPPID